MVFLDADMNLMQEFIKQGPLITALIIAIRYFYNRQIQLEQTNKETIDKMEAYMKDDREKLITVINANTIAMQNINEILKDVTEHISK